MGCFAVVWSCYVLILLVMGRAEGRRGVGGDQGTEGD